MLRRGARNVGVRCRPARPAMSRIRITSTPAIGKAGGAKFWFHGLRNSFITVAERELMLPPLSHQAARQPRPAQRRDPGIRRRLDDRPASPARTEDRRSDRGTDETGAIVRGCRCMGLPNETRYQSRGTHQSRRFPISAHRRRRRTSPRLPLSRRPQRAHGAPVDWPAHLGPPPLTGHSLNCRQWSFLQLAETHTCNQTLSEFAISRSPGLHLADVESGLLSPIRRASACRSARGFTR